MMAKYAGIDLSRWNGSVDFKKLKSGKILGSPVKFVMLRLSYGTRLDDRFRQYYSAAKSAGLYVGVYLYSIADTVSAARSEADWALEQLKGLDIDYPVAFDFEHKAVLDKKLSKEQYTAICRAFLDRIRKGGYYPILYTAPVVIKGYIDLEKLSDYDLWLAQYTRSGTEQQYGQTMWQFSVAGGVNDYNKVGKVPGVSGECDCNWSYVGYAAKIKRLGLNGKKQICLTAEVSVEASKADKVAAKLKALGCTVKIST